MLVQFTDNEGRETWINPIHVKVVRTARKLFGGAKGSEIWFGWAATSESINVPEAPADVAQRLSASMPLIQFPPIESDDDLKPPTPHHASE
ncbi:MAG: hypothetical protein SFZ24_02620 [Planctomycetota bacterium]|nr:hypothetical protein [Planctomycetota bacterium]